MAFWMCLTDGSRHVPKPKPTQNFWVLGFGVLGFGQFWIWFWDLGFGCSLDFNLVMENYSYPLVKLLGNC